MTRGWKIALGFVGLIMLPSVIQAVTGTGYRPGQPEAQAPAPADDYRGCRPPQDCITPPEYDANGKPKAASATTEGTSDIHSAKNADTDDWAAVLKAHELIKDQLRDPDAAIFDRQAHWYDTARVIIHRINEKPAIICGTVNAKNGFGGYNGEQYYVVDVRENSVVVGAGPGLVQAACTP